MYLLREFCVAVESPKLAHFVLLFLYQIGKYDRAIKAFEAILADLLDRYGDDHHRVGAALHNVAVANLRAGKLTDARDAIEEAVRIRENTLGKKHPKVAVSLGVFVFSLRLFQ